jgi:hypothetical protein
VRHRALLLLLLVAITAGCGTPSSVPKQAEDVASIAAEGALLAGDVADGDSTSPYAETHARALLGKAETLTDAIANAELRAVADAVVRELERLAAAPGDAEAAARIEGRLDEAATRAEDIGKRAS